MGGAEPTTAKKSSMVDPKSKRRYRVRNGPEHDVVTWLRGPHSRGSERVGERENPGAAPYRGQFNDAVHYRVTVCLVAGTGQRQVIARLCQI